MAEVVVDVGGLSVVSAIRRASAEALELITGGRRFKILPPLLERPLETGPSVCPLVCEQATFLPAFYRGLGEGTEQPGSAFSATPGKATCAAWRYRSVTAACEWPCSGLHVDRR
jgi:hypothetical protein